jgi:hypothetical protein
MPIPVSLVNKTTHTSQYHDIKLHMHKEEREPSKTAWNSFCCNSSHHKKCQIDSSQTTNNPKWSEASKDKVETDNFISGAHIIVMVPASGSVLIRISKLGFKSIRLGSVTLKNRSLSRASLALLQDPTTKHNKTSWKGNIQEKNPVNSSRKKLFQQKTLNPHLLRMFVKPPGTTYICGKPSSTKEVFKHYHIIFQ